jgi:quercetin dioxygenase-like cupin family protein
MLSTPHQQNVKRISIMEKPNHFPEFVKNAANAVQTEATISSLEGYVFDGADGSQMVVWESPNGGKSEMHVHDYDEYAVVVQGTCTSTIGDEKMVMGPGDECFIPAGVPHDGIYSAKYRAIDVFGAKRVSRRSEK